MSNLTGFSELSLSPQLLRAITEMGFETPSPIQAQALPLLLGEPTDFLGLAGTGTGKTAAFAIPLIARIDAKLKSVQSLILCPTRELALQVAGQITLLGKYAGVKVATVYGGAPFGDQVRALRSGAHIVVGTPGRVIDHLERKTLELGDVDTLILDEADEMFSMGFKEELDKIMALVSDESNTWLFSATMSPEVRRVVQSELREPKTVQVNRTAMLAIGVEQLYYRCQEGEKPEMICKLIEAADDFYGLIFCQTKALVADLTRFMLDRGYKVDCLHGDMDQNSRERTMQAFRDKKLSVLICTDVAARGLDVKDITHVVNYSLPRELESYVHRIGRTARSGKTGIVMNLLTFSHRHLLGRIEAHTKVRMVEGFVPTKREVAAKKVARLLPTFLDQPVASRVLDVMGEEFRAQLATMTPEDIASRFIIMMMPDIFGGEESRKTKKATKSATPSVSAPVQMKPQAPPVNVRPDAVAKPNVVESVSEESAEQSAEDPSEILTSEVAVASAIVSGASIEQAQLIVNALNDANAVVSDDEELDEELVEAAPQPGSAFGSGTSSGSGSAIDKPPRSRKKPLRDELLDEEEIAAMLEEPPTFGVVKTQAPAGRSSARSPGRLSARPSGRPEAPRSGDTRSGDTRPVSRPSADGERGEYPRSQSQFRAGPRESRFEGREGRRFDRPARPQASTGRFERAGGFAPRSGSRPEASTSTSSGGFDRSRPARPETRGSFERRPTRQSSSAGTTPRPAAPMNLAKSPKHEAGPARTAREGETGGLNRRARRAALFGRTVDGATESSSNS